MQTIHQTALTVCTLLAAATGQELVINVDINRPNGVGTYSGPGPLDEPDNDCWNGVEGAMSNLFASDGSPTRVSVAISGVDSFQDDDNTNALLADYQFVSTFFGPPEGNISITGLQVSTDYLIAVFSAGDAPEQAGVIQLNGVTACTTGSTASEFLEGANYVVMEVRSDMFGAVSGTWEPYQSFGAINGLQIMAGSLAPQVVKIAGAESPNVHSPGDTIPVTLSFNDTVTLSQVGGAELELDFGGTLVTAVHTGALVGESLTFEAVAPSVTTMDAKVVASSLQLVGGAALMDSSLVAVDLGHEEVALPNDQVSVVGLAVYPDVPTLAPSPHYRFRVREVGGAWQAPFAWFTKCVDNNSQAPDGYYDAFIGGWSHTYCNFEMANNVPLEIEITRLDSSSNQPIDIQSAVPHPRRKVKSWRVENGKAYVTIERPTLFAVDIDGQMDENPTPSSAFLNENALHAVSVFANPIILDKPGMNDPGVLAVEPGTIPPDDGSWTTLYFKPGVHQLYRGTWDFGDDFRLRSNRSYYIPGDAMVHAAMNNGDDANDGRNIRVFGHGTLSGERIDHFSELGVSEAASITTRALRISSDARGCRVEGLTFADPANHSCALVGFYNANPADTNYVRWSKVISWRANGDGISPNGSGYLEDCFLRTQDDGTYIQGLGIRRVVYWADVNGMPLRCDFLVKPNPAPFRKGPLYVEDIDVIYARTGFGGGPGRSIIGYPQPATAYPTNTGSHVIFRDINVDDPFPTRMLFGWDLSVRTSNGEISGVRFENIRAAARNVDGEQDILRGKPTAALNGLIFDNVTLGGTHYEEIGDFDAFGSISGTSFEGTAPETTTYLDTSGYGKWYIKGDWDAAVEPADNDLVEHTAVARVLTVNAPAYAGTLRIGHAGTATVAVETGGRLTVTGGVSIGSGGDGALHLMDGTLRLENAQASALSVGTGELHFERGELEWAGNRISDVQALYNAGAVTLSNGQPVTGPVPGVLIGTRGRVMLYAQFDAATGFTTVRAVM